MRVLESRRRFAIATVLASCTALVLCLGQANAGAIGLYGVTADQNVYRIDSTTGAATFVASLGLPINTVLALAVRQDGTVLLENRTNDRFYDLNPLTGVLTVLGPPHASSTISAIAFDSAEQLYAIDSLTDDLATYDTSTGIKTLVGPILEGGFFGGLSFNSLDDLFAISVARQLIRVDTSTGAGNLIGSMGDGLIFDGLAFDENDTLYSTNRTGGTAGSDLITVDPATGAELTRIPITGIDKNFISLDFGLIAVPEPSTALLLLSGFFVLGARRHRSQRK